MITKNRSVVFVLIYMLATLFSFVTASEESFGSEFLDSVNRIQQTYNSKDYKVGLKSLEMNLPQEAYQNSYKAIEPLIKNLKDMEASIRLSLDSIIQIKKEVIDKETSEESIAISGAIEATAKLLDTLNCITKKEVEGRGALLNMAIAGELVHHEKRKWAQWAIASLSPEFKLATEKSSLLKNTSFTLAYFFIANPIFTYFNLLRGNDHERQLAWSGIVAAAGDGF